MSESAAIIKPFFILPLHETTSTDTLQTAGAKNRALLGSNLSADSGVKTRLGSVKAEPAVSGIGSCRS